MSERDEVITDIPVTIQPWATRIDNAYKERGLTGYISQDPAQQHAPYWVTELNRWLNLEDLVWQPKKRQQASPQ